MGRAWGNALGGWRRQKRNSKGQFGPGSSNPFKWTKAARRKQVKHAVAAKTLDPIARNNPEGLRVGGQGGKKAKNTIHVVPYARGSLRSTTVGVNSGFNISKKRRISTGFYFRVENRNRSVLEKKIAAKEREVVGNLAKRLAPHESLEGVTANVLRKGRRLAINKTVLGRQHDLGRASGRLTTTMSGLPSYTIRAGRQKVDDSKRRAGIERYNDQMAKSLRRNRPKQKRQARRNAAAAVQGLGA